MDEEKIRKPWIIKNKYKKDSITSCWHEDFFHFKNSFLTKHTLYRDPYARDRDRIVFSQDFRRLEDKAQVYSPDKSDHIRTRLTHTIEVAKIAYNIGTYISQYIKNKFAESDPPIDINLNLIEAIAFGHDVGHTPFGHEGEQTINSILAGDKIFHNKYEYKINYGGFKHNFMSIKLLDLYSQKFLRYNKDEHGNICRTEAGGLNLSWKVLEGILKHTKIYHGESLDHNRDWDIGKFKHKHTPKELFFIDYPYSVTLEGQIVAIADEIAQRQHDIDDAVRDESYEINIDDMISDFKAEFISIIGNNNNSEDDILVEISMKERMEKLEKMEDNFFKKSCFTRDIVAYFINDVVKTTVQKIEEDNGDIKDFELMEIGLDKEESFNEINLKKLCKNKIAGFSDIGRSVNKALETIVNNKIINSYEVSRFDGKSSFIVRGLFKAYLVNPRQMPRHSLKELSFIINHNLDMLVKNTEKATDNDDKFDKEKSDKSYFYVKFSEFKENLKTTRLFDFSKSKKSSVDFMIRLLKLEKKALSDAELLYYPYRTIFDSDEIYNNILKNKGRIDKTKESDIAISDQIERIFYIKDNHLKEQMVNYFYGILRLSYQIEKQNFSTDYSANFCNINFYEIFDCLNNGAYIDKYNKNDSYIKRYINEMTFLIFCNYAFISSICDNIVRMTDSYAKQEYLALYQI